MKSIKVSNIIVVGAFLGMNLFPSMVRADDAAAPATAEAPKAADAAQAPAPTDATPSATPASPAAPATAPAAGATDAKKQYVCEKDGITKDAPGKCEKCGADLVEKVAAPAPAASPAAAAPEKKDEPKSGEAAPK